MVGTAIWCLHDPPPLKRLSVIWRQAFPRTVGQWGHISSQDDASIFLMEHPQGELGSVLKAEKLCSAQVAWHTWVSEKIPFYWGHEKMKASDRKAMFYSFMLGKYQVNFFVILKWYKDTIKGIVI